MREIDSISEVLDGFGLTPCIAYALRFFLRNSYESIVIVNKDSKVEFMDRGSERFFGIQQAGSKGMDIRDLVPQSNLSKIIETGVPVIGSIFEIKDKRQISSAYPIVRGGEIVGALAKLTLFSLEELERMNKEVNKLKREITHFKKKEQRKDGKSYYTFDNILGISAQIKNAVEMAKKLSLINTDILIVGESGTGKELFAHSIHGFASADRQFVKVNCPAIPFELAESELFGYEKGTFSGALPSGKPGKFEIANNGMIFLDELSSLPLSIQAKLLRVLQEREVERLGSTTPKNINFRFIGATNKNLLELVKQDKFRDDLYYRVAKAIIYVPPLRERREDIPIYLYHFLHKINLSFKTDVETISEGAMDVFLSYSWPGNVRELINVLEQSVLSAWKSKELNETHLPQELIKCLEQSSQETTYDNRSIREALASKEEKLIIAALQSTKNNKRQAAHILGMSRNTLYQKIKKYHITQLSSEEL